MTVRRARRAPLHGLLLSVGLNAALVAAAHVVFGRWFSWNAPNRDALPHWLGDGLPFVQFMALAFLVDRTVRCLTEGMRGQAIPRLAVQLLSAVIYFTFLGASVGIVFNESVSTILAASGIVGLAVGFAVRGLLSDLFSGIALHLDASFQAGDWLDVSLRGQQVSGKLLDIQWRTVVIADRAENLVYIPNGEFATATIINRSQPERFSEYTTSVAVGSQYDRARVVQVLDNALACAVQSGMVRARPAPYVRVGELDERGAVVYRLYYSLSLDEISPSRGRDRVFSHALDFLKAANIGLVPVHHSEIRRPAVPGQHRFTESDARLCVLADVPLLSVLSQAELATLAQHSTVRFYSPGQVVMRKGEAGTSMVVVVEGRLAVTVEVDGTMTKVATLWPGEYAGEMSLLTGSPRSADVAADVPTCLLEVSKGALTDILHANPVVVERIAAAVAQRTRSTSAALSGQGGGIVQDEDAVTLMDKMRKFFRLKG